MLMPCYMLPYAADACFYAARALLFACYAMPHDADWPRRRCLRLRRLRHADYFRYDAACRYAVCFTPFDFALMPPPSPFVADDFTMLLPCHADTACDYYCHYAFATLLDADIYTYRH